MHFDRFDHARCSADRIDRCPPLGDTLCARMTAGDCPNGFTCVDGGVGVGASASSGGGDIYGVADAGRRAGDRRATRAATPDRSPPDGDQVVRAAQQRLVPSE
jgi:hypothetical protein